jgi:dienelactone hydrolase
MGGVASAQTPPPASAFARLPATVQAVISPNGQNVAILGGAPADRTLSFSVIDKSGLNVLKLGDVETISVTWAGDSYAIARVAVFDRLGPRNTYRLVRNIAVMPDAKVASTLLKGDQISAYLISQPIVGVVDDPQKPKVIVQGLTLAQGLAHDANTNLRRKGEDGDPRIAALFATDPATGKGAQIERGDYDTEGWDVDLSGQARVMIKIDELTGDYKLMARPKGVTTPWTLIQSGKADLAGRYLGYSDPDDAVYLLTDTAAGYQIVRRKLAGGAVEPVGAPMKGATPWLKWDPIRQTVLGVGQGDGAKFQWLDSDFGGVAASLTRAFKGKSVSIQSWSRDRSRMIFKVEAADSPPVWYLFDRTRKEVSPVGESYPELANVAMGRTRFMTYKARDGLMIPAYVTVPAGAGAAAKLPLIVLPHGGPDSQDDDGFDYLTQFLVSRGYAVLRPQYRGSTGFGAELEAAGGGEWGGKMQTDLLDGVAALAASGEVDPNRVCIVGMSFGGYSALHGAVFSPGSYRCAASIAGVSDLGLLVGEAGSNYGFTSKSYMLLKQEIQGAAGFNTDRVSPLKNAEKAGVPILLLHGDQDTVVRVEHSKRMAEALRKAGKPVEYVTLTDDNHYLTKTASRLQVLEALDAFLAKNLPVSQP